MNEYIPNSPLHANWVEVKRNCNNPFMYFHYILAIFEIGLLKNKNLKPAGIILCFVKERKGVKFVIIFTALQSSLKFTKQYPFSPPSTSFYLSHSIVVSLKKG